MVFCCSLQALHKKLFSQETFQSEAYADLLKDKNWHLDHEIMNAVWTLARICSSNDANSARILVSDFISRVLLLEFLYLNYHHILGVFMPRHFLYIFFANICSSFCIVNAGWYWGPTLCCFPSSWEL